MTTEQASMLKTYQTRANIPPVARHRFIEDWSPRHPLQAVLLDHLTHIVDGSLQTLVVCGTEGTGKTEMVCSALNNVLRQIAGDERKGSIFYVTQSEMNMMFRSAMHSKFETEYEMFQRFTDYSILVIDEVGRSKNSEYQLEIIEALISKMIAWNKTLILISNDSAKEFIDLFDKHILDRLNQGASIEMNFESQRGKEDD